MIQNFAGVNPGSDDRNDLIIRGGSPSEVLFMIDNFDIPNPNHFATQGATGGPISLVNTEFIESVQFMAGGFTAPYGQKLSGVVDINFREGNRDGYNAKIDLNFGGAGGYLEGPILNKKGSFMIGIHRSYLDFFESILDYDGVPIYSNIQGKVVYDIDSENKLELIFLAGTDKIDIRNDVEAEDFRIGRIDTTEYIDPTDFKSSQITAGLSLRTFWNKNLYSTLSISDSYYDFKTYSSMKSVSAFRNENDELEDETTIRNDLVYSNKSNESVVTVKNDWSLSLPGYGGLSFGSYYKFFTFDHNIDSRPFYDDRPDMYNEFPEEKSISQKQDLTAMTGSYINYMIHITDPLVFNIGARYDYMNVIKDGKLSPRFGLRYEANSKLALNAGIGRFYQAPEFINITGNVDNKNTLKLIGADHIIGGLEYLVGEGSKFTLDGYYKRYFNYPVVNEPGYEMITLANMGSEYGNAGSFKLISKGVGRVYGIDAMLQKKVTRNLYGLAGYSYSVIEHKAIDGVYRPGEYDNKHVINFVSGYRINKKHEISLKWRYAGGRPYTPFDIEKSTSLDTGVLDLERINELRYKAYSRVDLRYDSRDFYEKFTMISYVSIENLLDNKNILTSYWNNGKTRYTNQIGRFFVGGFSIEF